jgi:hypothetical protein
VIAAEIFLNPMSGRLNLTIGVFPTIKRFL